MALKRKDLINSLGKTGLGDIAAKLIEQDINLQEVNRERNTALVNKQS